MYQRVNDPDYLQISPSGSYITFTMAGSDDTPVPILTPAFEPGRLDALAAGDIYAASPDPDIWSCIARARNLQDDPGPVHCDLVYGLRPAMQLGPSFIASPTLMVNVETSGVDMATGEGKEGTLRPIAQRIRKTIQQISQPTALEVYLHMKSHSSGYGKHSWSDGISSS